MQFLRVEARYDHAVDDRTCKTPSDSEDDSRA